MRTNHNYVAHLIKFNLMPKRVLGGPIGPSPWFPVGSVIYSPYAPTVPITVTMTPAEYWASRKPVIQQNYGNPDEAVWMALAAQGLWIDYEIMVLNQDPPTIMAYRTEYGYTWVPLANQPPIPVPPGLVVPGEPSYDPADTEGHIVTSVEAGSYPKWKKPKLVESETAGMSRGGDSTQPAFRGAFRK
jgi:hypothetical protein